MSEERPYVVIARIERTADGEVVLHLIRDEDVVHLKGGEEFVTVGLKLNPWIPTNL